MPLVHACPLPLDSRVLQAVVYVLEISLLVALAVQLGVSYRSEAHARVVYIFVTNGTLALASLVGTPWLQYMRTVA